MPFASEIQAGTFILDASERTRAADLAFARSVGNVEASRAHFAITQLKISQSEALITAADRLIIVLGRAIISRHDPSAAA